jgi:FkbM family methyltransferase
MTMRWFSNTHRDSHNQQMETAIAEVMRTREELSRLRISVEAITHEAADYKKEAEFQQKESEFHQKEAESYRTKAEFHQKEAESYRKEAELHQKEAKLRQLIGIAITRYFIKGDRSPEISIPYEKVRVDSNPDWIPGEMARSGVEEPEFMAFKYFKQDAGTILDIGANFGYAAASIWAAGANSRILSFEPNPWHAPCLQRIKEMRAGRFDYVSIGLGSAASETRFIMPVIERVGISALASVVIEEATDWTIPEQALRHMMNDHPDLEAPRLQFTEAAWQTERLDDVLQNRRFEVDLSNITAVKIDVEGFEADVLGGALHTLRTHTPLIMIEGANLVPAVVECLSSVGYRYADFAGDDLILSDELSSRINGFFLHSGKLEHYRSIGLLRS